MKTQMSKLILPVELGNETIDNSFLTLGHFMVHSVLPCTVLSLCSCSMWPLKLL